jgi:hypothetical protein
MIDAPIGTDSMPNKIVIGDFDEDYRGVSRSVAGLRFQYATLSTPMVTQNSNALRSEVKRGGPPGLCGETGEEGGKKSADIRKRGFCGAEIRIE